MERIFKKQHIDIKAELKSGSPTKTSDADQVAAAKGVVKSANAQTSPDVLGSVFADLDNMGATQTPPVQSKPKIAEVTKPPADAPTKPTKVAKADPSKKSASPTLA